MRRFPWKTILLVLIALAAVALPILFKAWRGAIARSRQRLVLAAEPFRIAGNFYYVGTPAESVFLITGPDGHVILNGTYPPAVLAAVDTLGFSIKDVKALIASDAHEGAEGIAELQQASGAQVWASDANAPVIASGGRDPVYRQPLRFFNSLGAARYTPARVDRTVKDGETIRVGAIVLTAHITAGNSRGCTSWSFPVRDGDRTLNVVSTCGLTRVFGMRYEGDDNDLEHSFQLLRSLPVDIWVTQASRDWGRYRKFDESRTSKDPVRPFIDPGGYHAFIDAAEGDLRNGVFH